jgi:hypothetical protein
MSAKPLFVVLVTGGRDYANETLVAAILADLAPDLVMHGDASGADRFASNWARRSGTFEVRCPYIAAFGKGGGPARNTWMVTLLTTLDRAGWDINVVAFPGGSGTADCVAKARRAGLLVREVAP